MSVTTHPLWQIRLLRAAPRLLLYGLCTAGLLASARFAIAPPRPARPAARAAVAPGEDLAAEGFASLFARRYLTWDADQPQASESALASWGGDRLEPDIGLRLPSTGEQRVEWAEVVQARQLGRSEHVYTVAAQTDTAGLLYLTVEVARTASGGLELAGYPAFVGAPSTEPAQAPDRQAEVTDQALSAVVARALSNYLGDSPEELSADLSGGARVALPQLHLALSSVVRLSWMPDGRSVLAVVRAEDARGAQYTLGYELDVADIAGRWEVSAVQMDPDG